MTKRNKRRKYINVYLFKLNDEINYTMIKKKNMTDVTTLGLDKFIIKRN